MLTDPACRNAAPREKPYKLTDEKGMYLHVMPTGAKYWRLKFYFHGKQKTYAIGVYPETSLKTGTRGTQQSTRLDQARH